MNLSPNKAFKRDNTCRSKMRERPIRCRHCSSQGMPVLFLLLLLLLLLLQAVPEGLDLVRPCCCSLSPVQQRDPPR